MHDLLLFLLVLLMVMTSAARPHAVKVEAEDLRVPHGKGVEIFVRNKRPYGVTSFLPDRVVVMQHGATYPGTAFDLRLGGLSWMDYLAERGFDCYALDLPGYGRSTRPAALEAPPQDNPPYMRTTDAVQALGRVVDFVAKRRGIDRMNVIGWSWGTAISATYAAAHPARVERLVLFAPLWHRIQPSLLDKGGPLGAYRVITRAEAAERRRAGLDEKQAADIMPKAWYEAWVDATFATDPAGGGKTIRAPNGVVLDVREFWTQAKATYDPAKIAAPVLIIVGELDRDTPPAMAQTLFPLLKNAPWRRLTIVDQATHSMLMEKRRMVLFRTVQQFLEELPPDATAMQ